MPKVTIRPSAAADAAVRQASRNCFGFANDVIGCEHQHQGVAVALGREHGGNRDRRPGIAAHRLEHDVRLDAALAQLLRHHEAKVGLGDHDRARKQFGIRYAREHLLKGRFLSDQGHELLGHALARDRPQPRAGAAAHDHRDDLSCHEVPRLAQRGPSSRSGAKRQPVPAWTFLDSAALEVVTQTAAARGHFSSRQDCIE